MTHFRARPIFGPDFRFSDFVVISCGINDMSRYGKTSHVLADMILTRLSDCCARHPDTVFIFNSVLHTKHAWLNNEVDTLNRYMFELSMRVPNLRFFDSHEAIVMDTKLSSKIDNVIDPNDKHKTHLTLAAKKLVTSQIVSAIELIVGRRNGTVLGSSVRGWYWPLRSQFVRTFRETAALLSGKSNT